MGEQWYYASGGKKAGPISFADLKQLASSGQLSPTDLVWMDGMPKWVPAERINAVFAPHRKSVALIIGLIVGGLLMLLGIVVGVVVASKHDKATQEAEPFIYTLF